MSLLRALTRSRRPAKAEEAERTIRLAGQDVAILLRRHPQARRIKLTVDPVRGMPVLTLPGHIPESEALAFLRSHADWVLQRVAEIPAPIPFRDGGTIPFRGEARLIRHDPERRRGVFEEGEALIVCGEAAHLSRRLTDFCRDQARKTIKPLVKTQAACVDRPVGRVILRDPRSRWGSCAANGDLSFSWRLILAPPSVLSYVVSHEVAHLVQRDHSRAFWAVVEGLDPDWRAARSWLADHGAGLHRIG